jgi:hypothetical protein
MRWLVAGLLALWAPMAAAEGMKLPSGLTIWPFEMLWEDHPEAGETGEVWLVLRFIAPEIARDLGRYKFTEVAPDIDHVCETLGRPLVEQTGGGVAQVLVTISDRALPRGLRDPEATQFMSAYRLESGACIWE